MAGSNHSSEKAVLRWLSTVDTEERYLALLRTRVPGTGEWFVTKPEFVRWATGVKGPQATLWCSGLPGTGKSMLMAVVIDHLRLRYQSSSTALAYAYCETHGPLSSAFELLSSLCKQLVAQSSSHPPQLAKLYQQRVTQHDRIGIDDLMHIMLSMCGAFKEVYVCMDGISNCSAEERAVLLQKLQWMRNRGARILITTTQRHGAPRAIQPQQMLEDASQLQITADQSDLRKFAWHQLRAQHDYESRLVRTNMGLDALVTKGIEGCGGMYLMLQLKLDREMNRLRTATSFTPRSPVLDTPKRSGSKLFGKTRHSEPASAVQPSTRQAKVWENAMRAIQYQAPWRKNLALTVLSWVTHASEPLNLQSLVVALSMYRDSQSRIYMRNSDVRAGHVLGGTDMAEKWSHEAENAWKLAIPLTIICGNLITIDRALNVSLTEPLEAGSHLAGKMFPEAHTQIAAACLRYISEDDIIESDRADRQPQILLGIEQSAFKAYAQNNWSTHYDAAKNSALDDLVLLYFHKTLIRPPCWVESRQPMFYDEYQVLVTNNENAFIKVARLGMDRILQRLLESKEYEVNELTKVSWKQESAVSAAVVAGHTTTVQLLYRYGASLDHEAKDGTGLLHLAVESDDEVMLALLINYGMDPNLARGDRAETALHRAAWTNRVRAGETLLRYGADMFLQSNGDVPMRLAAKKGHVGFVKLLVDHGFDLAKRSDLGSRNSFLSDAVESGSLELVSYMLAQGVSALDSSGRGMSAIQWAALNGNLAMVKLLHDNGANPFQEHEPRSDKLESKSALGYAIQKEHKEIVDYLVSHLPQDVPKGSLLTIAANAIEKDLSEVALRALGYVQGDLKQPHKAFEHTLLGCALKRGNEAIVRYLIGRGVRLNTQYQYGAQAIHYAAYGKNLPATRLLLQFGANINAQTTYKMTPLHIAAYTGDVAVLRLLLQSKSDLSIKAHDGSTALLAAAFGNNKAAVKLLLDHGAAADATNAYGQTVLHHAVKNDDLELVQSIIQYMTDFVTGLSAMCYNAGSALHLAAYRGHREIVQCLLACGADKELAFTFTEQIYQPPRSDDDWGGLLWMRIPPKTNWDPKWTTIAPGWRPLHAAVSGGHLAIVETLLSNGVQVTSQDLQGETALHLAASAAKVDIISLLLKRGLPISATNKNGETCFHSAAAATAAKARALAKDRSMCSCEKSKQATHQHVDYSKVDCVSLLYHSGANPACESLQGLTPLAAAVLAGHDDVVQALLRFAPHVRCSSRGYVNVLSRFDAQNSSKLLETLCQSLQETGPSIAAWDSLLCRACSASNEALVKLSLRRGATPLQIIRQIGGTDTTPLEVAIEKEQVGIVDSLIAAGADLRRTSAGGLNALHLACKHPDKETLAVYPGNRAKATIASYLVEDGVHVNGRTNKGDTALHYAVTTGDTLLVKALLQHKASVDIRNASGSTPLHAAVSTWVFPEIVNMLLQHGASPTAQDNAGRTPLHLVYTGQVWKGVAEAMQAVEALLREGADHAVTSRMGEHAIHCATRRGDWRLVERLMQAGASIHEKDRDGRTLLHLAAEKGHVSIVETLVKLGADTSATDTAGYSPRDLASDNNQTEIVSVLSRTR